MIEALKWSSVAAFAALAQWIAVYTWLQPWWRSWIGRSLVGLAAASMVTPALFILSLFFNLSRATSQVLAWAEVAVLIVITIGMVWRSVIWVQVSRDGTRGTLPAGEPDKES